jgi:hypothetical protein
MGRGRCRPCALWPLLGLQLLGLQLLGACTGEPDQPTVTAPPAAPARVPPAVSEARPPRPEFCHTLAGVVAREPDGYVLLRGQPEGREQWRAASTLPGLERCTIEGERWPRARLTCASAPIERDSFERALDEFELLTLKIDNCLAQPIWFPRSWRRGRLFEFAMGERQIAWMDQSVRPPTAVVLKVQQDLVSQDYLLQVNVESVRP